MNNVNLIGRITNDLKLRTTQENKSVCEFTIAVNRIGSDKTDFINCCVWGEQAENLKQYQCKGSLVAIRGNVRVDKYKDSEGKDKYKNYIFVKEIEYLERKKQNTMQTATQITTQQINSDPFKEFEQEVMLSDEDLPF